MTDLPITSTNSAATLAGLGTAAKDTTSAAAQKDQFLHILLTQLQNQNPTDPMKPEAVLDPARSVLGARASGRYEHEARYVD